MCDAIVGTDLHVANPQQDRHDGFKPTKPRVLLHINGKMNQWNDILREKQSKYEK